MGLTRRKDTYYVEFRVIDDGRVLWPAPSGTGKLKRWKSCRNKAEARKQEAVIKTSLMTGQVPSLSAVKAKRIMFSEWAETYLSLEHVKALRSEQRRYSVKWLKRYFVEILGDKPLEALTTEDVRNFRAWRGAQGVAVQTVNHDHAALRHMLGLAMSEEFSLLQKNVAAMVKKPNPNNERDRVATPEEWDALKQHGAPHLVRFLTIAYDLGPRRGELLKLEWPDVDMRYREFKLRETKNREARVIPMTEEVYEIFKGLWQGRRLDTARVFLYNSTPVTCLKTAFRAACRRAGVKHGRKNGGLTIHDFRHTASTNLRRAGVDTMTAMRIVGHKSEKMHRRYNQITPEDLHGAALKLGQYKAANTLITPGVQVVGDDTVSQCQIRVGA
jgi:integrase